MQRTPPADLIGEAERYLAAVAVFRAEGCEPHWRLEPGAWTGRRRRSEPSRRDPLELTRRIA